MPMRSSPWAVTALLLLSYGLGLFALQSTSLTHAEAHAVWVIAPHELPDPEGGLRAVASALLADFQQALMRSQQADIQPPLFPLLSNAWALFMGESAVMLRVMSAWAGLVALAAGVVLLRGLVRRGRWLLLTALVLLLLPTMRTIGPAALTVAFSLWSWALWLRWRRRGEIGWLALFALVALLNLLTSWLALFVLLTQLIALPLTPRPRRLWVAVALLVTLLVGLGPALVAWLTPGPDWRTLALEAAAARPATAPAVYALPEDHPLRYYDRRYDLLHGIAIDLGWRRFTPGQAYNVIRRLRDAPQVWVFAMDDDYGQMLHATVQAGVLGNSRQMAFEQRADGVFIARYDLAE